MLDIGRLQLVSFSLAIVQLDRLECKMNGSSINILSIRHLIMHIKSVIIYTCNIRVSNRPYNFHEDC